MVQAYLGTQRGRMVPSGIFWNMRVPVSQEDTNEPQFPFLAA